MSLKELEWVSFLKKKVKKNKDVLVGIGDDCAYVKVGRQKLALKSDLFIEGIHFDLKKISLRDVGIRAVARVLSDFAACGAIPKFIGISVGIPKYIKKRSLKYILAAIINYSKKYNFSLIGGDTSVSERLFFDVWGVGTAEKFIKRDGARIGDYIFVTGTIGRQSFSSTFKPKLSQAQRLIKNFKINSMIDISDGFAIDLYRIIEASSKGAIIFAKDLPLKRGVSDIFRGEDYELIFTVDRKEPKIDSLRDKYHLVGEVVAKSRGYKMIRGGKLYNVKVKGYSHF